MSSGFVTGPHRVDQPHPDLVDGLTDLWGRVSVAGGAVGFRPSDPLEKVREAAAKVVDDVSQRRAFLITVGRDRELVGAAVLTPQSLPARAHTGELSWLMVDPDLQGTGWGRQLHDAVLAQAQAVGLTQLELITRSGQDLERYYEALGWVERGRWPGAVRLDDGDTRDEVWLTRDT
ncbi:GNAT family N-acetyltransferase [Allosaccharopolyspora coralli]|uniref:GNAT family N-acetyltransferase n=1 Tax=Allosaccharopolyspora coralli TaxID=2665642 RepID=A0A5Q3QCE7_9PSEU|nr:GNAT family N-acetyltransferase [Allosaccharopolyspora coralli]QGK69209.1 GNAT family N-acetyltransferase [Allosaccharopolyspora coralli]